MLIMPFESKLELPEAAYAALVGILRQISCRLTGVENAYGYDGDGWGINVDGAGAECAFAKAANLYWRGFTSDWTLIRQGDIGNIEVKWRGRENYGLPLREGDPRDRPYVLVTGKMPTYLIVGWLWGWEIEEKGKEIEAVEGRNTFWVVDDYDLLHTTWPVDA